MYIVSVGMNEEVFTSSCMCRVCVPRNDPPPPHPHKTRGNKANHRRPLRRKYPPAPLMRNCDLANLKKSGPKNVFPMASFTY